MEKEAALEQTLKPNWGGQKSCQKRLDIIDVIQGIAMLWVIVGHHLFDFMPPVYGHIHYYIYSFHMPLFIFISGFLIAYSYKGISYRQYVYRRFHKFFVPYVIVGIIITLLAATKGGIASIGENLVNLVVSPKQSEATFLWYIYLLFVLYAIFPFCEKGRKKLGISFEVLLLLIGICFYLFPIGTTILCLDYFSGYFLFYAIGVVAAWHFGFIKRHLFIFKSISAVCLIGFVALSVMAFMQPSHCGYIALCFTAIPAMYIISDTVVKHVGQVKHTLIYISKNCFHIYLVHMFFVQAGAMAFSFISVELSVASMFVYLAISTTIAVVGPVLAFKLYDGVKSKLCKL